jgi:DNA-binding NtrC family response regulator
VDHFLKTLSFNQTRDGSRKVQGIDREALDLLASYRWPGNVRELLNVMERAISFAEGDLIQAQDLPDQIRLAGTSPGVEAVTSEVTFKEAKERWVSSFERDYILALLRKNSGNISHAAREADIDRKYFRKLMRKYGIDASAVAESSDVEIEDEGE